MGFFLLGLALGCCCKIAVEGLHALIAEGCWSGALVAAVGLGGALGIIAAGLTIA